MNSGQILGRLTRDVETRTANNGTTIGKFSIAVNQRVKNGDQWEDQAHFFDCVAFGKTAEIIAQYRTKGDRVLLEYTLEQDRWEDKQTGEKRSKVALKVNRFHFPDSKGDGNQTAQATTTAPAKPQVQHVALDESDIPF